MKDLTAKRALRCAIYTRVSTDQGLERSAGHIYKIRRIRSMSAGSAIRAK
jgi:hypothetical protein